MSNGDRIDRRAAGVQKVIITDGNGGKQETIQVNVEKAQVWINFLKAFAALVIVVAGAMWGAVRWGVSYEVHEEVETAMEEEMKPGGKIDRHMHAISMEAIEEVQGVLQDDLDYQDRRLDRVETDIGEIKAGVEHLNSQQQRNVDEIRMLLQRALDESGGGGG
jgi:uncharacterized protein YoxC